MVSSSRLCFEFLSDFPQLRIRVWICKLKLHPLAHLAYSQTVLSQQLNKIQRQQGIDAYYIPGMNNRLQERGQKFGRLESQVESTDKCSQACPSSSPYRNRVISLK